MADIEWSMGPGVAIAAWICATIIVLAVIAAVALPWQTWGDCHCPPMPAAERAPAR